MHEIDQETLSSLESYLVAILQSNLFADETFEILIDLYANAFEQGYNEGRLSVLDILER